MRVAVSKTENFYIVIEVQRLTFEDNTLEMFEEIFDKELEQACKELRQTVKERFNEIKQSAEGDTGEGGSNPRISDR
jgi:hypothetical protein